MRPVVVVRNERDVPPGYLGEALEHRDIDWSIAYADMGDGLPEPDVIAGAVVLGGAMGAYDEAEFPHLAHQKRFMARCVEEGVPVLGICLGSQLLADALGGRAYLADSAEVTFAPVDLTEAGREDPVAAPLAGRPVLRFHRDTFELPAGGSLLAAGGGYPQVFRIGSAIGIQPHPEVTSDVLAGWLADGEAREMAIGVGTDPEALIDTFRHAQPSIASMAADIFDAWIDEVTGKTRGAS